MEDAAAVAVFPINGGGKGRQEIGELHLRMEKAEVKEEFNGDGRRWVLIARSLQNTDQG